MTTAFTNVLQIIAKRLFFILLLSFEGIQTEEIYSSEIRNPNNKSQLIYFQDVNVHVSYHVSL